MRVRSIELDDLEYAIIADDDIDAGVGRLGRRSARVRLGCATAPPGGSQRVMIPHVPAGPEIAVVGTLLTARG